MKRLISSSLLSICDLLLPRVCFDCYPESHLNEHKFKHGWHNKSYLYFWRWHSIDKSFLFPLSWILWSKANPLWQHYLRKDSMDRYLTELRIFISFSNSFFIWLSVSFCLFILFCYLSFLLISQMLVTFLHLVSLAVSFVVINFLFS